MKAWQVLCIKEIITSLEMVIKDNLAKGTLEMTLKRIINKIEKITMKEEK